MYSAICYGTGFSVFSNGVGRSGAFCGLLTLIEIIKMETAIDFYHKVKAMRIQRPGMVQTVVITDTIALTTVFVLFV